MLCLQTPHLCIAAASSCVGPSVARGRGPEQTANHIILLLLVAAGLLLIAPVLLPLLA